MIRESSERFLKATTYPQSLFTLFQAKEMDVNFIQSAIDFFKPKFLFRDKVIVRLPCINPVSIVSAAASQPEFIVAAAMVTRLGKKILLSVDRKDYAKVTDHTSISWGSKTSSEWVKEPYDCVVDYFETVDSSNPYRSEVIKGLLAWQPMIDVFSNGDLLVVSSLPINPGPHYESTPNASVFKDGVKYNEFNVGYLPNQMNIDAEDRIWFTITDDVLTSYPHIKPKGEPVAISRSHLSPMCIKRTGELDWDMMPWTKMENNSSDYCYINVSNHGTWVLTDAGAIGLGRVDAEGKIHKLKTSPPVYSIDGIAVSTNHIMSSHSNGTTSMSRLGEPVEEDPKVFILNCKQSEHNTIQQFIFREDKIHIRTEKYWATFSIRDVMRQLEQFDERTGITVAAEYNPGWGPRPAPPGKSGYG